MNAIMSFILSIVTAISMFTATSEIDSVRAIQIIDRDEGVTMTAKHIDGNEWQVHLEIEKTEEDSEEEGRVYRDYHMVQTVDVIVDGGTLSEMIAQAREQGMNIQIL